MLLTKRLKVKWGNNRKHYEAKGYICTKQYEEFEIDVYDLSDNSDIRVEVQCDYCAENGIINIMNKQWKKYLSQRGILEKDACRKCGHIKEKETSLIKYGYEHYTQTDEWKNYYKENWDNGRDRITIEYVRECFEKEGYKLISTEYINNEEYLYYECPKHGEQRITWCHFKNGKRCPKCFYESNKGENNNKWNGGITDLNHYFREKLNDWKNKSLEKCNYSCYFTGIKGKLEIHHIYSFYKIVQDTFNNLQIDIRKTMGEYSVEELNEINKEFLRINMDNLGSPIIPELHKLYHTLYGLKTDTPKDFYEFVQRFDNHEFDDILQITHL